MPADLCPRCAELATALAERDREIERLRATLGSIGSVWPLVLEVIPWGAFKAALMEDGAFKVAMRLASGPHERAAEFRRELGLDGEEQP